MKTSDICLVFRFRDEDDNIDRYIRNNFEFCDCFVALDDRSTNTEVYDKLFRHPKCASIVRKNVPYSDMWGSNDQEVLLSLCKSIGKAYILSMDIDEILDMRFHDELPHI